MSTIEFSLSSTPTGPPSYMLTHHPSSTYRNPCPDPVAVLTANQRRLSPENQ